MQKKREVIPTSGAAIRMPGSQSPSMAYVGVFDPCWKETVDVSMIMPIYIYIPVVEEYSLSNHAIVTIMVSHLHSHLSVKPLLKTSPPTITLAVPRSPSSPPSAQPHHSPRSAHLLYMHPARSRGDSTRIRDNNPKPSPRCHRHRSACRNSYVRSRQS